MLQKLAVRAGDDPDAGILGGDFVDGEPGGDVDRRLNRPEVDVLMPGDFSGAGLFPPEIGRPDDDIGTEQAGDALDDGGMRRQVVDGRVVHVPRLHRAARVGSFGIEDIAVDFLADGRHIGRGHGGVGSQVAVFDEEIDIGAG